MKKQLGILAISTAILLGLVGYAYYQKELNNDVASVDDLPVYEYSITEESETVISSESTVEEEETEDKTVETTETEITEETETEIENVIKIDGATHDSLSYAYQKINEDERAVYDVIYTAIVSFEENVTVPTLEPEVIEKAFNCVMMDHPEIFYVNGYRFTKYTRGGELKRLAFSASYCYSESEAEKLKKDINAAVDAILANVYPGATEYQKIKYAYDIIVLETEYDVNSADNQNIISVLINKKSVCQGYAKTLQLLLNRMGIPCTLVTGTVSNGESHAWNAIMADGQWYYADVTWGDSSYKSADANKVDYAPPVNYDYLLVTSPEISSTHTAEDIVELPYAQAIDDNYYVKEGLYVTTYNPEQIKAIFDYARALGQKSVSFKCSDPLVYNQVRAELIDNQKVFDYLVVRQIRYVDDANMRKLMFALQ